MQQKNQLKITTVCPDHLISNQIDTDEFNFKDPKKKKNACPLLSTKINCGPLIQFEIYTKKANSGNLALNMKL